MDLFEKCHGFRIAKDLQAAGLYPYFTAIESGTGPEVVVRGRKMIMIGSNNYLGLTQHPHVKESMLRAVEKYGSGCTGSRFLNGTLDLHEELERRLARFMNRPEALLFTTGFLSNQGTISTIVGKDDVVIIDRAAHASIFEGCRLAFGRTLKYRHNDMNDLERILQSLDAKEGALIVTDGVFSMEGDLADLPSIVKLKKKYGARLMVDDAHGIGVFGKNGRGTAEHFGLEHDVDIIMGTFSKSFASLGGFIVAEPYVLHFIKHLSRALTFSASMPPAAVAAVLGALDVIEREPERRARLWENAQRMKDGLTNLGYDTGHSRAPIIPVILGEEQRNLRFWRDCFERGLYANPVMHPATPMGRALIRTSYMATHSPEVLDRALSVFAEVGRHYGIGRTEPVPAPGAVAPVAAS
ncbi:MAG: pyridoxal phosphate-dependent aminotransferase family protein [Planctomycetes bacterium]|nr:pyridoxal phosphate-dependent aminotransferase family protein [Planctomycetota bacterium]